jgi:hypothetical protein
LTTGRSPFGRYDPCVSEQSGSRPVSAVIRIQAGTQGPDGRSRERIRE